MWPTVSESKIRAPGSSVVSCFEAVVLPTPKVPFSQMITATSLGAVTAVGWANAGTGWGGAGLLRDTAGYGGIRRGAVGVAG
ncbi:hypothetical protein GCM10009738_70190 [Kitasatospora viridis]